MTTKDTLIKTTAKLIRQKGLNATGINEILKEVGVPKGSLYHHFPGGKDELLVAAINYSKDYMSEKFKSSMKGKSTAIAGLSALIDNYASGLKQSNFNAGCPLAIASLEAAGNNEVVSNACKEVYEYWIESLVLYFKYKNIKARKNEANEFMIRLEGSLLISQITKSDKPLKNLKKQLNEILKIE
jgi:TetR/AcrR family transcriptional regulator, lmrAB and yxaGH operons repressor